MFRSCRSLLWLCCLVPAASVTTQPASAFAGPTVKFVLADGAKISDTATISTKVTPDKDVGIEKVEFAVNNQLKVTDRSTPYSFDWDTLEDKEGEYTITATAFDAKGQTARATLKVVIDNELTKGADAHADTALAALKEGDTEKATRYSRRALIIAPTNLKAARALAGIYRANGEVSKAVATLGKAEMPEKEIEARKELIALHIAKADESPTTEEFLTECLAAGDLWKKVTALQIEAAKAAGDSTQAALALGDAYFTAHDYLNAIRAYQKTGTVDAAPREALGRHLLALIRQGKYKEANSLVGQISRANRMDESITVIQSMLALIDHQFTKARDMMEEGTETGSLPAMVARIYANLPLRKDRESQELADKIAKVAPENADVQLAIAFAHRDPIESRKALMKAIALDPTLPEAYALYGYLIMLGRDRNRYQAADSVLDYALKLDPNNLYSIMAKVVCLQAQKRPQEAEPLLAQLLEVDKNAPDVHVSQALNLSLLDRTLKITEHMNTAFKLDQERWNDVFVPKLGEFPVRVFQYRYQPVMNPSTLYPAK